MSNVCITAKILKQFSDNANEDMQNASHITALQQIQNINSLVGLNGTLKSWVVKADKGEIQSNMWLCAGSITTLG